MNREELTALIRDEFGAEAEYLWADSPDDCIFRHGRNRKWFAVLMRVSAKKIGADGGQVDILNVKCDPMLIGSLLKKPGYYPAYHMNKTHWLTVQPDRLSDGELYELINLSYGLTAR